MFMNKRITMQHRTGAMQITKRLLLLAATVLIAFSFASVLYAASPDAYLGTWTTQGGKSKVQLYKCGDKLCGRIVRLTEPNYPAGDKEAGKPKRDRNNPNEARRNRPIQGMNFVWGFTWDGSKWAGGKIYNPEEGKTYSCYMELQGPKRLHVRGYVGVSYLGKSVYWTR